MNQTTSLYSLHSEVYGVTLESIDLDPEGDFREDLGDIDGLAKSIEKHGLINAVTLQEKGDGTYKVRAGRRRIRALRKLGWTELLVPEQAKILSKKLGEEAALLLGIAENADRLDMSPMEEAKAYQAVSDLGVTQNTIAEMCGKSRPVVANRLRLLKLPEKIQNLLQKGKVKPGHAEHALLPLNKYPDHQAQLADQIASGRYDQKEASRMANSIIEDEKLLAKWRKAVDASEYKVCPTCGRDPSRPYHGWQPPIVQCDKYHKWNLQTGKVKLSAWERERDREKAKAGKTLPRVIRSTVPIEMISRVMMERCRKLKAYSHVNAENLNVDFNRWGGSTGRMSVRCTEEGFTGYGVGSKGFSIYIEKKKYKDEDHNITKIELSTSGPSEILRMTRNVEEWLQGILEEDKALSHV